MRISKLFINRQVAEHPITQSVMSHLDLPPEVVRNTRQVYEAISATPDPVRQGKETLYLTRNRGAFFKKCPGTRHYTCCNYQILHIGSFCHMDCTYCVLQTYFHPPILQYFVNHEDLLAELDAVLKKSANKINRIGTGEFTDSLIWESWTDLTPLLVQRFAAQNRAVLELKTKTTAVERLQNLNHNHKTIAAWSLNTHHIIRNQERSTASLNARFKAAARCEAWGYPLAFHFDPLILYDGCQDDYTRVIEQLYSAVSADNIVWVSLGTLRFPPSIKTVIQNRFPDSKIIYEEFIKGPDGKMRYFKPLRIELYRKVVECIRDYSSDTLVYLCMEDDEVWRKSLGFIPDDVGGLSHMLDQSAVRHCKLKLGT